MKVIYVTKSPNRRLLSIRELSKIIGLKPQTIRNKLSSGTFPIPTIKFGKLLKWDSQEIFRYLDKLPRISRK